MLIISFSVAVEENRAEEVRNKLMDEYGVAITREGFYTEKLCWHEAKKRVYWDCYTPYSRFKYVTDYLDNEFDGNAILTY